MVLVGLPLESIFKGVSFTLSRNWLALGEIVCPVRSQLSPRGEKIRIWRIKDRSPMGVGVVSHCGLRDTFMMTYMLAYIRTYI